MAQQIGFYNATHEHGEPLKNMLAKLKARRQGGAAGIAGEAVHAGALDPKGQAVNRANAPKGDMPDWVQRQINQQGGLPAAPGGIPAGVVPTKPVEAIQGSDALTGLVPATGAPATGTTRPASALLPKPQTPYPLRRPDRRNRLQQFIR